VRDTLNAVSQASGQQPAVPYPFLRGSSWPGEELTARVRETLRPGHLAGATDPITGVDANGCFLDPLLWTAGPPVVVDANWLRNDLLYCCSHQRQTVMLTAANRGLVRLYCAQHVLDEVVEHHADWARTKNLPPAEVLDRWTRDYLPLLRLVDPPAGLLQPAEQARIDLLHSQDPDDVPSATLAILLQAPLISSDKRPTRAVYGPGAAVRQQAELRELFQVAGDTVQLREMATTAALLPYAGGSALLRATFHSARRAPALTLLSAGALALWLARGTARPAWQRIGKAAGRGFELAGRLVAVHQIWQARVQAAAPEMSPWDQLASSLPARPLLTRALIRTLAYAPSSQRTVAELIAALPSLPVASGQRPTRDVLRTHHGAVFQEFPRGRWQLGRSPVIRSH
jgi:predicted nucleic acid-binding protein